MGVGGERDVFGRFTPPPPEWPGMHCIGGWAGPRDGQDVCWPQTVMSATRRSANYFISAAQTLHTLSKWRLPSYNTSNFSLHLPTFVREELISEKKILALRKSF